MPKATADPLVVGGGGGGKQKGGGLKLSLATALPLNLYRK